MYDDIIVNGVSMHAKLVEDAMDTNLSEIEESAFDTIPFLFDIWLDDPDAIIDWWLFNPNTNLLTFEEIQKINKFRKFL